MSSLVYVLNGPNLDLLGSRQPEIYGKNTLSDIEASCAATAAALGLEIVFRQSNHEGILIDLIHEARDKKAGIVINPAAFTHYSIAIMDALSACDGLPIIEVHLSNIHRREAFRRQSYVSMVANAVLAGCGPHGYVLALEHMARLLGAEKQRP